MTLSLGMITTDSVDPVPLAQWWAERFGGRILQENDGWFVLVEIPGGILGFQKVDDPTPGKNRIHLDLGVGVNTDLDATAQELVAAGATLISEHNEHGHRWITFADPQGNQFCVAPN